MPTNQEHWLQSLFEIPDTTRETFIHLILNPVETIKVRAAMSMFSQEPTFDFITMSMVSDSIDWLNDVKQVEHQIEFDRVFLYKLGVEYTLDKCKEEDKEHFDNLSAKLSALVVQAII